jgi:DNA-binding transcriptional regulator GbsR (MarR family)
MAQVNERSSYIEDSGILFESLGMTRMAGRIMGYLMITDKDMVSFDEFTMVLQASKSSISTSIKALLSTGFIRATTLPGDRKTYYLLAQELSWADLFKSREAQIRYMLEMFSRGYRLRTNPKDKSSQWLIHAMEFYEWMMKEIPELMERWENRNIKK